MQILKGSELRRKTTSFVNRLDFDSALDLILETSVLLKSPTPFQECEFFLNQAIHLVLESILLGRQIEHILALYIRYKKPEITDEENLLKKFHLWLILEFKIPTKLLTNKETTTKILTNKETTTKSNKVTLITQNVILQIKLNSRIWNIRLASARILLLIRIFHQFCKLDLICDARSLSILLSGIHVNLQSVEFSLFLPQWVSLILLLQHLQNPKWQSEHLSTTTSLVFNEPVQFSKWSDLSPLIRSCLISNFPNLDVKSLLNRFSSWSSFNIQSSISNLYQVFTPHMIDLLENVWDSLSLLLDTPLLSLSSLSYTNNKFNSPHKLHCIQAIHEAIKSPRPKYRHGAVLVRSNKVLSIGRNEYVKESKKVQRVRHAEIDCLVKVIDENGMISMEYNNIAENKKRRLSDGFCFYIVEIDEYGFGYSSSHACPSCTAALIRTGIHSQYYSTPNGFQHEIIKQHNPFISVPTLDVIDVSNFKN